MKVLITGAGGYIGSIATKLLLEIGFEVVALDNFKRGFNDPLKFLQNKFPKKLFIYKKDLRDDLTYIFKNHKNIDGVLHYGALCLVNESMEDPGIYFSNNVGGSLNLLNTLVKFNVKNIVFSSTCAVYGEAKYLPVDEAHPTNPSNPYGQSKKQVEEILQWFGKIHGINYVILRYFNVCGASSDGQVGDSKKPSVLLVQNVIRGVLGIEKFYLTCPVVKTTDKTPIRDYINVVDLNMAHIKALDYLQKGGGSEIINLGTGKGNSVLEIVKLIEKETGVKIVLNKTTPRQGEYAEMVASIKKAKKVLGWKPKHTLEDSVKSLLIWYKLHPNGWKD